MGSAKKETPRPEAGADTRQGRQGPAPDDRVADSGGTRTPAGSDYGDFVPNRGQPRRDDDRDTDPVMGNYTTGGGNIDRLGDQPQTSRRPEANETPERSPEDRTIPEKEETAVESNRNKGFDTTHVHTATSTRKV